MTEPSPTFDDFQGHQGETCAVDGVPLTLTSAETWGRPFGSDSRQPFTLHLHGPREPFLAQGTYRFEHAAIGALDLFIVPLGPDEGGMRYEVIFS